MKEMNKQKNVMINLNQAKDKSEVRIMIDKFCLFLTNKIRQEIPEIDDERAEIINYGLQNIVGEIPKFFILIGVAWILGVLKETLITFFIIFPYRIFSGGFHLKTHIGCIITTILFYMLPAVLAKTIVLVPIIKYLIVSIVWIFGMIMIKLYAPADTENVPILRKKERRQKQILSYIVFTIGLIISVIIKNNEISNIIIFGYFIQTLTITRLAYIITNNKYGYEVYNNTSSQTV